MLQDAIKVEQPGGPGSFEVPEWNKASLDATRAELDKITCKDLQYGLKDAIRVLVTTMLQSPRFLYREGQLRPGPHRGRPHPR